MHWAGYEVGMGDGLSREEGRTSGTGTASGWAMERLGDSASSGMVRWGWLLLGFSPGLKEKQGLKYERLP